MPGLIPWSQSRPADVYDPTWIDGKVAFDVSVVSPMQEGVVRRAADYPASAIRKNANNRAHHVNCRVQGIAFVCKRRKTIGRDIHAVVEKRLAIARRNVDAAVKR